MKARKEFRISLPSACAEDWEQMTPAEKGRFCNACNKVIIDFFSFTNTELISFLSSQKSGICGRFSKEQLQVNLQPLPAKQITKPQLGIPAAALVLLGFSSAAQQTASPITTMQEQRKNAAGNANTDSLLINGALKDDSGQPIQGAKIWFDNRHVADSDSGGRFQFHPSLQEKRQSYTLRFEHARLPVVYRSYHTNMQSTSYDVVMEGHNHCSSLRMGMIVWTDIIPEKTIEWKEPLRTTKLKIDLAEIATSLRNNPTVRINITAYGSLEKEKRQAKQKLAALKSYFFDQEGITKERVKTVIKPRSSGKPNTFTISTDAEE